MVGYIQSYKVFTIQESTFVPIDNPISIFVLLQ